MRVCSYNGVSFQNLLSECLPIGRYFKDPPRYQILHCLRNRVVNGHSKFVDGINACIELQNTSPEDFACLSERNVAFHYINDGHHLHCSHPTIETRNADYRINFSPPFQAPLPLDTPPTFFDALSRFTTIVNRTSNVFTYLMREGDAVIFDNRRVLHGRTAFSDKEADSKVGETNRWLKGCYLEEDAVHDKRRVLSETLCKPIEARGLSEQTLSAT